MIIAALPANRSDIFAAIPVSILKEKANFAAPYEIFYINQLLPPYSRILFYTYASLYRQ